MDDISCGRPKAWAIWNKFWDIAVRYGWRFLSVPGWLLLTGVWLWLADNSGQHVWALVAFGLLGLPRLPEKVRTLGIPELVEFVYTEEASGRLCCGGEIPPSWRYMFCYFGLWVAFYLLLGTLIVWIWSVGPVWNSYGPAVMKMLGVG